ncbi:GGDEF domain-containing protein [Paucibacter sp. M5-1]|uniref:GGDEF domain-containing protein n=1 Tax=Paucibacter sp. M5-1 TaxID=3015998 RepID=UPI0022B8B776|nr:GGDEF domain-containing protein [Paucibacter sp. M5-1]MCZ7883975.1 GGDEF domain-containing protein [Paucibacter sp. M5-1]
MDERRPSPPRAASATLPPAQVAKAALHRLALSKQEPTPENYAAAYAAESGAAPPAAAEALPERVQALMNKLMAIGVADAQSRLDINKLLRESRWDEALRRLEKLQQSEGPGAQAEAMAALMERMVRGLERGGRQWTVARKKDGLQRVLASNRSDPQRLLARLQQLVRSWDSDVADASIDTQFDAGDEEEPGGTPSQFFTDSEFGTDLDAAAPAPAAPAANNSAALQAWGAIGGSLQGTVEHALRLPESDDAMIGELLGQLQAAQLELSIHGADASRAEAMEALCVRARRLLDHRHHVFGALGGLCRELSASLVELAEDDSWAHGQCEAMNNTLELGLSARGVRSVAEMLSGTRERQRALREERGRARDSLKSLIHKMLAELGELGEHTDRFQHSVGRYADVIEKADSLESLAGVVREMVEESRSVQSLVQQTQARLSAEHDKASSLSKRVNELESELKRLSDEVQTDQLTQIANRRGLIAAFGIEQAKLERQSDQEPSQLALALLDIDNFKKLNDSLGHAAGDMALKSLAERVSASLRPGDMVARYGGEEFVLMLPNTPLDEAQQVLTRLQRALSMALFMHEGKDVFVTFSAGVTPYRPGETLEAALDRADVALYEAKHTGKNKACVAP